MPLRQEPQNLELAPGEPGGQQVARNLQLIMAGSIVAAGYGDEQAARRAHRSAELLIELAAGSQA